MAISSVSLKQFLAVMILVAVVAPSALAGNAIAGTVRDASTKKPTPLGDVKVTVVQDSKAKDVTRDSDGAYAIDVSGLHSTIDLVFSKDGYTSAFDANVGNDKSPNKRPVVYMAKKGRLTNVPKKQLEAMVKNTLVAAERAKADKLPNLTAAIKENLKTFKEELGDADEAVKLSVRKIGEIIEKR